MDTDVKLICCDIDGTLARDDKTISSTNIHWIQKAIQEASVRFTLVSGRPESGIKPFYEKIGISGLISCFNGGRLLDESGTVLDDHRVPHDVAMRIMDIWKNFKVDMVIFNGSDWYIQDRDSYAYRSRRGIYLKDCITGDLRQMIQSFDSNKCFFLSEDPEVLRELENQIIQKIGLSEIVTHRSEDFLEVTARGYDKGTAVTALSRIYNIPISQIMAIGDEDNDVEMLKTAGISVAMANATASAKAAAKYMTDTNNDDGVAKAIQRFVFKR